MEFFEGDKYQFTPRKFGLPYFCLKIKEINIEDSPRIDLEVFAEKGRRRVFYEVDNIFQKRTENFYFENETLSVNVVDIGFDEDREIPFTDLRFYGVRDYNWTMFKENL